jgi:hypothetical protein
MLAHPRPAFAELPIEMVLEEHFFGSTCGGG